MSRKIIQKRKGEVAGVMTGVCTADAHCRETLHVHLSGQLCQAAGGNIREKKESTGCSQRCVQKGLRAPLGRAERSLAVISSIFKGLKAKKVQRGLAPKFAEITHQMPYNL